jgi:hypothetical protein
MKGFSSTFVGLPAEGGGRAPSFCRCIAPLFHLQQRQGVHGYVSMME